MQMLQKNLIMVSYVWSFYLFLENCINNDKQFLYK